MPAKKNEVVKIEQEQGLNEAQMIIINQKTPRHLIKRRKGRGGKNFDYLPHAQVARILNEAFSHFWSFETEPLLDFCDLKNEVTVKGTLTVHGADGKQIVKEQYGSQDLLKNKNGEVVMSYGDALKGAASDALKKCASLLGIALDLYANEHQWTPGDPEKITAKQIDFILRLIKSHVFSEEERVKAEMFCENGTDKAKAQKFIDRLLSLIQERKAAEKETAESPEPEDDGSPEPDPEEMEFQNLLREIQEFRETEPDKFNDAMANFKIAFGLETATQPEHFEHILNYRNAA